MEYKYENNFTLNKMKKEDIEIIKKVMLDYGTKLPKWIDNPNSTFIDMFQEYIDTYPIESARIERQKFLDEYIKRING